MNEKHFLVKLVRSILERLLVLIFVLMNLTGIGWAQSHKVGDLIINSDGSRGIVFFVHPDRSGGWMVALNDLGTVCEWGAYNDIPTINNNNLTVNPGSYIYTAALYDTAGYYNTQKIRTFQNNNLYYAAGQVDFANGWYLPAIGQLVVLWGAQPFINNKLSAAGGTFLSAPYNYWSSSEYDISEAWNLNASQGYPRNDPKDIMVNRIRAVRSFTNTTMVYDTTISYLWNTGSTQPNITATPNTTTSYTVTVTSGLGCTNTASQNIFVNSVSPQILYDTVCLGFPYMENGFQIGASDNLTVGTTLHTRTISQNGCQATIHLYLYKKPTASATLNVSLCEGEPYILNGLEYYSNGTYYQHLSSQNGCDSLLTLNLSYYPNPNTVIHQTACDSYSWNGIVYSQSGIYSQVFSTSNGCDSTVILHLTIKWSSTSTITQTVNENQLPVTFNGQIFTNDVSNYMITIPNFYGCDSVITYSLTVNWNTFTQLQDTICQNSLPYIWNGITFYSSGDQSVVFTSFNGADSIIDMTLVVMSNTTSTIVQTVYENQLPFLFNGHLFTGDVNNYLVTITNSAGCDSSIVFTLNVNWNTSSLLLDYICESDLPYVWNGVTFYNSAVQSTILTSHNGADSLVTMKLEVLPNTTSSIAMTINDDQLPFTFNGETFTGAVDNYLIIISNEDGCDSLIYLTLNIFWLNSTQITDTICSNSLPYLWNGITFNSAGTQTAFLSSSSGEDSIVMMTLIVNVTTYSTITQTVNENQLPYVFNGHLFTNEVNNFQIMITNANGCDSIISFTLNVNWNVNTNLVNTICQNSLPFIWNGIIFNNEGTQSVTYTSSHGADSTITMTVLVNSNTTSIITETVNENQLPYTFHGVVFANEVINEVITIPNSNGCDSIIFFNLNINWNTYTQIQDTVCQNSIPFVWNGITFFGASTQTVVLNSTSGADSVVTMTLFVTPVTITYITQTVNENQLPITYNGQTFYHDLINFVFVYTNVNGCDSMVYYTLDVNWNSIHNNTETICEDDLPYMLNGITFNAAGSQSDTLLSVLGSDSIVITTLIVHPATTSIITETITENQLPFYFNGQLFMDETVNQMITIPNFNGCDSVITFSLYINWNISISLQDTICQNSLPFIWNGITFYTPGTQSVTLTSYTGADSVVVMTLDVHPNTFETIHQMVQENDLPVIFNGYTFMDEVDQYQIIIENSNGCDSVITYSLEVNWNTYQTIDTTVCSYDLPFYWHGFTFLDEGTIKDTILNSDNTFQFITYTLHVDLIPVIQFSGFTNPICPTNTDQQVIANINSGTPPYQFTWSGDSIISTLQNQAFIKIAPINCGANRKIYLEVQDQIGCIARDTAIIELDMLQAPYLTSVIPSKNGMVHQCQFSIPDLDSLVRAYTLDHCYPVDSLIIIQNPVAGVIISSSTNVEITISNPCGNSIQTSVLVYIPSDLSVAINQVSHVLCYGQNTGSAVAVSSGGTPNYTYKWSPQATQSTILSTTNTISNVAAGVYTVTVTDMSGCSSNTSITIQNQTQMMNPGTIASDQSICIGNIPAILEGNPGTGGYFSYYQWQSSTDNQFFLPAIGINDQQSYSPAALSEDTYFRRAWISNACGTIYTDTLFISILPIYRDTVGDVVCQGFEYNNNGFILPPDSTNDPGEHLFNQHLYSVDQCDSIITLLLTILPSVYTNIEDTICQGATYVKNGFYVTSPITDIAQVVELEILLNNVLGCDSIVSLALHILDTTLLVEMNPSDFCESDFVELVVQGFFNNYQWSTGETTDIIEVNKPGTYSVTASNEYCENKGTFTIQPCDYIFYIPNSFTPNGDGLNDAFSITTIHKTQMVNFKIVIFNRWGQKLFESYDPDFRWDGTYKGQMVAANQVYTYLIEYQYMGKGAKFLRGSVIVLQ